MLPKNTKGPKSHQGDDSICKMPKDLHSDPLHPCFGGVWGTLMCNHRAGVKWSGQTDWGRRTLFTAHLAEQFRFMFTWDSQKIGIKWCSLRSTQACVSVHVNVCEHRGRHMWILGIAVNKPKVNKLSCYLKFVLSKPLRKIFVNPFFVSWDWNLEPCMLPLTCSPNPRKTWVTFYEK